MKDMIRNCRRFDMIRNCRRFDADIPLDSADTALDRLALILRILGPISTVRVSSAKARGRAKNYAYWGAVRYELRLTRGGEPVNVALESANSDRRSYTLAERDAEKIAEEEGRVECGAIGRLTENEAQMILTELTEDGKKNLTPKRRMLE